MDKRISDLTSVSSLNNNDVFAVVNNNETKKVSFENLKESLPGASQSTTNNAYLVPVRITVQDGDSINLTGSTYENTSMIELIWSGSTGNVDMFLPDATTSVNTNRAIRFISNGTFNTSTRVELTPSNGQTLDGSNSPYTINKAYEGIMVWSDGTEWYRVQTKA